MDEQETMTKLTEEHGIDCRLRTGERCDCGLTEDRATLYAKTTYGNSKHTAAAAADYISGFNAAITELRTLRSVEPPPDATSLLRLILPLAKGYAHEHPVGSNQQYVSDAEEFLAGAPAVEPPREMVERARYWFLGHMPWLPEETIDFKIPQLASEFTAIRAEAIEETLAKLYAASDGSQLAVANLCDDVLDTSGGLLGRVRKRATALRSLSTKGAGKS